jgi:hypothetical protein
MNRALRRTAIATLMTCAGAAAQANSFSCLSGSDVDCTTATGALSWSWDGLNFTIANAGGGYVSEVYFDLDSGMSVSFYGGTGAVQFQSNHVSPRGLPGGNSVGFVSDAAFDSDTRPRSTTDWGINAGESATFRILGASADGFASGGLVSGIHVRGLANTGNSVSLVTSTRIATAVPEPEGYAMMALGLGVIGWSMRQRRQP